MPLIDFLLRLVDRQNLSADDAFEAASFIMQGEESPAVVAGYLTALRMQGESAEVLAGTARSLREHSVRLSVSPRAFVDTCGTGGSPVPTFNISTAAAIVASACGVPVAKHGNRSFSSSSGSADALAGLGVNINADVSVVARTLEEVGLAFLFAPLWHPSMKHVAPVRRELKFRTVFNLVGPLANPAPLAAQIVGVGRKELLDPVAGALSILHVPRAAVIWGEDGTDEVTLSSVTHVRQVMAGQQVAALTWTPADFALPRVEADRLAAHSPTESAQRIHDLLDGKDTDAANVVAANVAALLWAAGEAASLSEGASKAREAIGSGQAKNKLRQLVESTNRPAH